MNRLFLDKTQAVHCLWLFVNLTSLRLNPLEHSPSPGCILYKLMLTSISNFCQEKEEHDTVVMTVNYKSFEWLIPESGCWHNFLLCKLSNEVMQEFLKMGFSMCRVASNYLQLIFEVLNFYF